MTNQKLSVKVEAKIKSLIAEGHLKIGDRLPPERELAEAMNVSRHTLREAIKSLEALGILKSRPGSGTFIFGDNNGHMAVTSQVSDGHVFTDTPKATEIFQFRLALEPTIAVFAANNATTQDLAKLKENLTVQAQAIKEGNNELWAAVDLEFHLLLTRCTGNSLFVKIMEILSRTISVCVDREHLNPIRTKLYYKGHYSVYQAVVARDPRKAAFHMEEHLRLLPWQENLKVSNIE